MALVVMLWYMVQMPEPSVRAQTSTEGPERVRRNTGTRLFTAVNWKVTLDMYTVKFRCLENFMGEK